MSEILQAGIRIGTIMDGEAIIGKHIASGGRNDIYTIYCQGQGKILRLQPNREIISPIDMVVRADGTLGYVVEPVPPEYQPFTRSNTGCRRPVIVFASCRGATVNYEVELQELQSNN